MIKVRDGMQPRFMLGFRLISTAPAAKPRGGSVIRCISFGDFMSVASFSIPKNHDERLNSESDQCCECSEDEGNPGKENPQTEILAAVKDIQPQATKQRRTALVVNTGIQPARHKSRNGEDNPKRLIGLEASSFHTCESSNAPDQ